MVQASPTELLPIATWSAGLPDPPVVFT